MGLCKGRGCRRRKGLYVMEGEEEKEEAEAEAELCGLSM
jgi:hypothetical protein